MYTGSRGNERTLEVSQTGIVYGKVRGAKTLDFSGCKSRPGTDSPHPVAIDTAVAVTKLLELSMESVAWRLHERAGRNVRKPEQATKRTCRSRPALATGKAADDDDSTSEQAPSDLPGGWKVRSRSRTIAATSTAARVIGTKVRVSARSAAVAHC